MCNAFSITELQTIIAELKSALLRAAANGGVTSYTINSGQGSTTVHQASIEQITNQINFYNGLLQETIEIETGSNIVCIRDLGI